MNLPKDVMDYLMTMPGRKEVLEKNREKFIEILTKNVNRPGIDRVIKYLDESDFFYAPASTRFHGAYPGGLCEHSLNVFNQAIKELGITNLKLTDNSRPPLESITIATLLHDLCKANFYAIELRNKKIDGKWVQVPAYTYANQVPLGHGEKSAMMLMYMIRLTMDELMAIRWHMGAFDSAVKGGENAQSEAFNRYPLAVLTHIADLRASYYDEAIV